MTKLTIGEKIKFHRKRVGMTLTEMAEKTGINNGNLSKIENRKQGVTEEGMEKIASVLRMSLVDMIRDIELDSAGKPIQNSSTINSHRDSSFGQIGRNIRELNSLDEITIGENIVVEGIKYEASVISKFITDERVQFIFNSDSLTRVKAIPRDIYGLEIKDDAMTPRLFKGDHILIDTGDKELVPSGGVYAVAVNDSIEVRRLFPKADRGMKMVCDNVNYLSEVFTEEEKKFVTIIGRVKAMRGASGL